MLKLEIINFNDQSALVQLLIQIERISALRNFKLVALQIVPP